MLWSMLSFATPVRESSSSINEPMGCCNPCEYPSGSGKELLWISSCDCLGVSLDMIPFEVIVDRLAKVAHFVPIKTTYIVTSRVVYV
jgi:hypothetical protein